MRTSHHCRNGDHRMCLHFYGGKWCDCLCHVRKLAPRRGWKK